MKKSYVKLCEMQHNLLRKYEEEVNMSTVKQDLINRMHIEIEQLRTRCGELENVHGELEKCRDELATLGVKHRQLVVEHESTRHKLHKYKSELKCFDDQFFDEIEELKYNYAQALELNKHYEQLIDTMKSSQQVASRKPSTPKRRVKFNLNDDDEDDDDYGQDESDYNQIDDDTNDVEDIFSRVHEHYARIKRKEDDQTKLTGYI